MEAAVFLRCGGSSKKWGPWGSGVPDSDLRAEFLGWTVKPLWWPRVAVHPPEVFPVRCSQFSTHLPRERTPPSSTEWVCKKAGPTVGRCVVKELISTPNSDPSRLSGV